MADSPPINDLLLAVASGAIGVMFAGPAGWLKGRSDERAAARKRRQDDHIAAIESTEKFVLGALRSLREPEQESATQAPDPEVLRLKDDRLLSESLWETWLEATVALAPLRGVLDGPADSRVRGLESQVRAHLRGQRDRVIDGNRPILASPTSTIHSLYAQAIELGRPRPDARPPGPSG